MPPWHSPRAQKCPRNGASSVCKALFGAFAPADGGDPRQRSAPTATESLRGSSDVISETRCSSPMSRKTLGAFPS